MICINCVMDETDPAIVFNSTGVCNHCVSYQEACNYSDGELKKFQNSITELRESQERVLVGVSGGVDSTYLAWYTKKKLGLNVVLFHVDNGWNSAVAVQNLRNLIDTLNLEFHTSVLDWNEFKQMQRAILYAGVPDLEAPTDLFINYGMRKFARENDIKIIMSGTNPQTEHVMGYNWSYGQRDPLYLRGLYKKYNNDLPTNLPLKHPIWAVYNNLRHGIEIIRPLKYDNYSAKTAKETIQKEVQWRPYERKHGESFITTFYQDYFLPVRFGIDKRKAHFSSLILNGEISRDDALVMLESKLTGKTIEADISYFCEKLDLTRKEFDELMAKTLSYHNDYYSLKSTSFYKTGIIIKKIFGRNKLYKVVKRFMES